MQKTAADPIYDARDRFDRVREACNNSETFKCPDCEHDMKYFRTRQPKLETDPEKIKIQQTQQLYGSPIKCVITRRTAEEAEIGIGMWLNKVKDTLKFVVSDGWLHAKDIHHILQNVKGIRTINTYPYQFFWVPVVTKRNHDSNNIMPAIHDMIKCSFNPQDQRLAPPSTPTAPTATTATTAKITNHHNTSNGDSPSRWDSVFSGDERANSPSSPTLNNNSNNDNNQYTRNNFFNKIEFRNASDHHTFKAFGATTFPNDQIYVDRSPITTPKQSKNKEDTPFHFLTLFLAKFIPNIFLNNNSLSTTNNIDDDDDENNNIERRNAVVVVSLLRLMRYCGIDIKLANTFTENFLDSHHFFRDRKKSTDLLQTLILLNFSRVAFVISPEERKNDEESSARNENRLNLFMIEKTARNLSRERPHSLESILQDKHNFLYRSFNSCMFFKQNIVLMINYNK